MFLLGTCFLVGLYCTVYRIQCRSANEKRLLRRSTVLVEAHPNFSEAPHSPHPKTDFIQQKKSKCIAANNPMAQVYQNIFFRNQY